MKPCPYMLADALSSIIGSHLMFDDDVLAFQPSVKLTTVNGSDAFDAGKAGLIYE